MAGQQPGLTPAFARRMYLPPPWRPRERDEAVNNILNRPEMTGGVPIQVSDRDCAVYVDWQEPKNELERIRSHLAGNRVPFSMLIFMGRGTLKGVARRLQDTQLE